MDDIEHLSPDGKFRLLLRTDREGDVSIGFAGYPWHTHGTILAATSGRLEGEAVRQFLQKVLDGSSVIAVWSREGKIADVWVSEDPLLGCTVSRGWRDHRIATLGWNHVGHPAHWWPALTI